MNAAIEAARAGEHGRGFAVVADEVRKLAEGSASASRDIAELISGVSSNVAETVKAIKATNAEVQLGTEASTAAGESLVQIVSSAQMVAEQTQGLDVGGKQVALAITNVAAVSEETAASAEEMSATIEEIAASAQELNSMSADLETMVARFKVDGGGSVGRVKGHLRLAA